MVIMVGLDAEKAYDKVYIPGLAHKIFKTIGDGPILRLMIDFLTNRKFVADIDGMISVLTTIKAGVPQGGCISPDLYRTDVKEEPDIIKFFGETYDYIGGNFFADDNCSLVAIPDPRYGKDQDTTRERMLNFQRMLDEIILTANRNGRKYHKLECLVLYPRYTTTNSKYDRYDENQLTEYMQKELNNLPSLYLVDQRIKLSLKPMGYLGILLDKNLDFKPHVSELKERVRRRINVLKYIASQFWGATRSTLNLVWKQWIATIIDYYMETPSGVTSIPKRIKC